MKREQNNKIEEPVQVGNVKISEEIKGRGVDYAERLEAYVKEHASVDYLALPDAKPGDFALIVEDDDMAPTYPRGTLLHVRKTCVPINGSPVVAVLADKKVVFRIFSNDDKGYCLRPIDPTAEAYTFEWYTFGAVEEIFSVVASYASDAAAV